MAKKVKMYLDRYPAWPYIFWEFVPDIESLSLWYWYEINQQIKLFFFLTYLTEVCRFALRWFLLVWCQMTFTKAATFTKVSNLVKRVQSVNFMSQLLKKTPNWQKLRLKPHSDELRDCALQKLSHLPAFDLRLMYMFCPPLHTDPPYLMLLSTKQLFICREDPFVC